MNKIKRLFTLKEGETEAILRKRIWTRSARKRSLAAARRGHCAVHARPAPPLDGATFQRRAIDMPSPLFPDVRSDDFKRIAREIDPGLVERADRLLQRRYRFLNASFDCENGIDWHLDPVSRRRWPLAFFKDIAYTGEQRLGDVKLPWELGRQQFLVTLGQAYVVTGDRSYADEIVAIVQSWIDANPPYLGIHWISALEVGIRLISWIWAFECIKASQAVTPRFFETLLSSVYLHADYLENNLTIGRYANNHLIGEAAALALAGTWRPEFKRSGRWTRKALVILERELQDQVLDDGGGAEQAMSYLRFITEFFLCAFLPAEANRKAVSRSAFARIERAFEFMAFTGMPDGTAPAFGDSDDARVFFLGGEPYWDFRGLLALASAIFERNDFKCLSGGPSAELLWIGGQAAYDTYMRMPPETPGRTSFVFEQSGYAVSRSAWARDADYLLVDFGRLGFNSAGHGHADMLSVQLVLKGQKLLIDPGTFAYNQEPAFRDYFRSTAAHNTVTVDGRNQADSGGRMAWLKNPTGELICHHFSERATLIEAAHSAYSGPAERIEHRRTLLSPGHADYYLVLDTLCADQPHQYHIHFHLNPDIEIEPNRSGYMASNGQVQVCIDFKADYPIEHTVQRGAVSPISGWYSARYGQRQASPTIIVGTAVRPTAAVCTLIAPMKSGLEQSAPAIVLESSDGIVRITVKCNESMDDTWLVRNDRHQHIALNGKSLEPQEVRAKDTRGI